jgi:D-serine deaminase-like pyridoxal phosphate-dependent protein
MMPSVKDHPDAVVNALSAEHCQVKLSGPAQDLKIGDKVELRVPYSDFTTVLHDQFLGFRNGTLETVWPILGRGKLQ